MYLGKMIEVTREAPANLGTAMKTIIARFEDMKKDPMAILEDGVTANKVEAALATIGIALRNSEGEFRALQDVMDELGMKWNSLTRNQQAYIATVAAGSRQQSRFLALMNNYDRTLDLINESQNSAGAAAEQYAIYQDSAAAATARLTAAWEEFYSKIVNSEQIIWVINALEKLVETMSKIGPVATAIGTTIGALGLNLLGKAVIPNITQGLATVATTGEAASLSIGAIVKGGGALLLTFGKAILIIGAITAAIYGLVKAGQWIYNQFHQDEIQIKELSNSIEELNDKISDSDKKISSLENLMNKYDELTQKIYLTKEEHEELNNVINQINENSKRAVITLDKNGDAHLENAKSIREEIEAEKEYIEMNAKLAYSKKNEFLNKGFENITEEQAQQAGLDKLVQYKNIIGDETLADYQKYKGFSQQLNGDSAKITGEFQNFYQDNLNSVDKLNKEYFDETYETSKSLIDTLTDVRNKALLEAEQKAAKEEKTLTDDEIFDKQQEAVNDYALRLVQTVYGNLDDLINYTNDEYTHQIEQEINNEVLTDYYNQMALVNGQYKVLTDLFEKSGMTAEEFKQAIGDEDKFLNNYTDAIEEYINSDKTTEDVQKLTNVLINGKEKIANQISEWIDNAIKETFASGSELQQFFEDNYSLFSSTNEGQIARTKIKTGSVTNDELAKMKDLALTNEFVDSDKFGMFALFAEDNTTLNKYIDDYVKNLQSGFYKKADNIKQLMVNLLAENGISQGAAERLADFFVPDLNSELDKRLSKAEDDYKTAREIFEKDPTESLTEKEYSYLKQQDINADRYININAEGEKYLSILGKINLLENARTEYINQTNKYIEKNVEDILRSEVAIFNANKEIETGIDLTGDQHELSEEEINSRKTLISTNEQIIVNLKQQNNLLSEQLQTQLDINNQAATMALGENLSQAKQTADNIEKIGKALGEAQANANQLSLATAQGLLALDDSYHQYINIVDGMVTLNADGAEAMRNNEQKKYNDWLELQKNQLRVEKTLLEAQLKDIQIFLSTQNEDERSAAKQRLIDRQTEINTKLQKQKESDDKAGTQNNEMLTQLKQQYEKYYEQLFAADDAWKKKLTSLDTNISQSYFAQLQNELNKELPAVSVHQQSVDIGDVDFNLEGEALENALQEEAAQIEKRLGIIDITLEQLDDLSVTFDDSFQKGIADAAKSGGKEGEKAIKNLQKAIDDLLDSLEDLDKLLIDIRRDLDEVSVDYNPFTELFEAWEKEWDYFYNIRRLMEQISTQAQYIDNLANAEYATADQRLSADHAKIGNILSSMSANDTYIEALRAGMSQTAVELMKDFGEYYKVDPTSGQIYQTDANLSDINALINQRQQEIYNLQKLQNEKENDLALENAKLDALEQEKSAYESILSTIESQYDSLKDNEDITIDLSQLGAEKEGLQVKIQASDASIDELKQTIHTMEDELQNIEVDITLKQQNESELENYVSRMEDKVQEYEEYWENLNNAIVEQQEHLAELQEMLNAYVDIAISTQQELYSAIVENYQDEINEKKKQYDYLKQLDNDYLNSLKDNINKQRQAREDANKQKSYQQNLQRAQLLQMDTSGAFRSELANVNKEIENQRQELYDDLVDKQVEALEKEIEKRHELYDKEVAALEERLAYMQENAILLWEMVNSIVAEGATAMMATLENTTAYINADELTKANQRTTWEYNVKKTFEGVEQGYINSIQGLINIGNTFVTEKYPEIEDALDDYTEVFNQAIDSVNKYNSKLSDSFDYLNNSVLNATDAFQNILDSFMVTWNERTNEFTGYAKNWETITNSLKTQTENNLKQLQELYNEQGIAIEENIGSIRDYDEQLRIASEEMYNDFLAERERYRDELNGLIDSIRVQIEGAIKDAADAIRNAANSISATPSTPQSSGASGGAGGSGNSSISGSSSGGGKGGYKGYTVWVNIPNYNLTGKDYTYQEKATFNDATYEQLYSNYEKLVNSIRRKYSSAATFWGFTPFKTGGIADFTGPAWLDGSKSQPERILSPRQTRLFESMVSSLEKASNNSTINSALGSSYNIGDINTNINVEKLDNETDIDKVARQVENRIMKSIRNRVSIAIA